MGIERRPHALGKAICRASRRQNRPQRAREAFEDARVTARVAEKLEGRVGRRALVMRQNHPRGRPKQAGVHVSLTGGRESIPHAAGRISRRAAKKARKTAKSLPLTT